MQSIFEEWRRQDGDSTSFISDGIIDQHLWEKAPRKVLFLLKEAYNGESDKGYDLCKVIRNEWQGAKYKIWWLASYWAYGAHRYDGINIPEFPDTECAWQAASRSLLASAVVNIKKSDGKSSSDMADIGAHANKHRALLWRQIELINPDIVICGGTWEVVSTLWGKPERVYDRVHRINGKVFVDCYHPANHYPNALNYYAFMGLVHGASLFR